MYHRIALAGAALAALTSALPHVQEKRDVKTVVDVEVVTVTKYVTAGAQQNNWHQGNWHPHHKHTKQQTTEVETSNTAAASPTAVSAASETASTSVSPEEPIESPTSGVESSTAGPESTPPTEYAASSSTTVESSASPTTEGTSPAAPTYGSGSSSSGISLGNLTPNGKKAGLSGYIGISDTTAFSDFAPYISWYSDYTPNTPSAQGVTGVGMLWGASGSTCGDVTTERVNTFNTMMSDGKKPDIMFGFYEPDCACPMSADMSVSSAVSDWESLLAPLAKDGTVLGSPSMCKQKDEDFLTPFNDSISTTWDVTAVHINKYDLAGAKEDVEYYKQTYGKPIWVAEFACVHDSPSWAPCTDQTEIDTFINDVVSYFESNDDVVAYGPSNGAGLGDVWPLTSDGELTASGKTYLNAIKAL